MEQNIALAPVTAWDIGPIPAYGAVTLRLGYLTHATQRPSASCAGLRRLGAGRCGHRAFTGLNLSKEGQERLDRCNAGVFPIAVNDLSREAR